MTDPADNPLPVPNSEQEYLNGVADNGDPLTIVSEHLIPPRDADEAPPPIGGAAAAAAAPRCEDSVWCLVNCGRQTATATACSRGGAAPRRTTTS